MNEFMEKETGRVREREREREGERGERRRQGKVAITGFFTVLLKILRI